MIELRRKIGNAKTMDDMADLVGEARGKQYFDKFRNQIATFVEREDVLMEQRQDSAKSTASNTYIFIVAAVLFAILLCVGISYIIVRSIGRLAQASQVVNEISTGNLSVNFEHSKEQDEISDLLEAMQKMVVALKEKASVTDKIANGDLSVHVNLISQQDELGKSLQNMIQALQEKVALANEVVSGNLNANIKLASNADELGRALQTMVKALSQKAKVANEISQGNLAVKAELASEHDELGKAFQNMIETLQGKVKVANEIALGNLEANVELSSAGDELGKAYQKMIKAMRSKVQLAQDIAKGDLTVRADLASDKDQLGMALQTTTEKLTEIVGNIITSANGVEQGVSEIASGNIDLQQRTETQASTLEETAASMEEMSSSVKEYSERAKNALMLSETAEEKAKQGGDVVSNVIVAMQAIDESSRKINDIIGVIDEISFQTNLLALNAAVEAARAGEQGRGFAVVASEVRNLAQRSATNAREIKDLIKDSGDKVQDGTKLAELAGGSLNEIVESVLEVNQEISSMSRSSEEQASGIQQISLAISNMDSMTQQNSALVEEITASGQEMKSQTQDLQAQVNFFRLNTNMNKRRGSIQSNKVAFSEKPVKSVNQGNTSSGSKPLSSSDDQWESF